MVWLLQLNPKPFTSRPTVTYWLCHPFFSVTVIRIGPRPVLSRFDHCCHSTFGTHICQDPFHHCNFTEFTCLEKEREREITAHLQHLCNLMQSHGRGPQHQICSETLFCFRSSCEKHDISFENIIFADLFLMNQIVAVSYNVIKYSNGTVFEKHLFLFLIQAKCIDT